ncbi:hypothetical protein SYNTR_2229 [Candidatus Syntrophocurvum alkaliphilum]|uniref:Uncharacterized protein n=1 Tax=Candidatus Syntrophocurvum alkaliphilum TaxID=2293317 RepID=A0A6I6DIH2_9FIRM|nr:hypothetical protein SYNTR_2229 [Candidatus Syntrophocurvum alkaliphilum]
MNKTNKYKGNIFLNRLTNLTRTCLFAYRIGEYLKHIY